MKGVLNDFSLGWYKLHDPLKLDYINWFDLNGVSMDISYVMKTKKYDSFALCIDCEDGVLSGSLDTNFLGMDVVTTDVIVAFYKQLDLYKKLDRKMKIEFEKQVRHDLESGLINYDVVVSREEFHKFVISKGRRIKKC